MLVLYWSPLKIYVDHNFLIVQVNYVSYIFIFMPVNSLSNSGINKYFCTTIYFMAFSVLLYFYISERSSEHLQGWRINTESICKRILTITINALHSTADDMLSSNIIHMTCSSSWTKHFVWGIWTYSNCECQCRFKNTVSNLWLTVYTWLIISYLESL